MEIDKQKMVKRKLILQQLQGLLEPWLPDDNTTEKITERTNLLTDLGIDSVGILQLVLGVEREFDITIKNHELDSEVFSQVSNFINIIEGKIYENN